MDSGESYIELHLPIAIKREKLLTKARGSLSLIAEYILAHDLQPTYIVGMTYPKLANVATRLGFARIQNMDTVEISRWDRVRYKSLANFDKDGCYDLLYYETPDFIARYAGKTKVLE